ncbi:MAG: outer membrane lipoprotein carrier protein LolA [Thermoanaerobaculia bacterium]|nr:outer membrane lipoprotein carrier protein LolA [Thermoanaerobaculia bacterium]
MRHRLTVLSALLLVLAWPATGQGPLSPATMLERIQKKYSSSPSVKVTFVQTYAPSGFGETAPETGTLVLQAPDSLRFEYDGPEGKLFTFDGKAGRQYVARDRQMIVKTLTNEERARLPLLFLSDPRQVLSQFEAKVVETATGAVDVQLSPRSGREPGQITVFASRDGELKRLVVLDPAGNKTTFTFTKLEPGKKRPASDFTLIPPAGTKIVTG